jgi:hypothetical protein
VPTALGTFLDGSPAIAVGPTDMFADLKAFGTYGDGTSFETGPFQVVVTAWKPDPVFPTTVTPGCGDPSKPVFVNACPQVFQSGVPLCVAPATP